MEDLPKLTIEERILLVLADNLRYDEAFEVPSSMTQEGLSELIGANRPNTSRSLGSLLKKRMVRERLAHVKGHRRRKKAYMAMGEGIDEGHRVRENVSRLSIGGTPVSEIAERTGRNVSETFLYLSKGGGQGPDPVGTFPRKDRGFFGRREEAISIQRWAKDPDSNVLVIWGLAGIGKTALVKKALSRLRFDIVSVPVASTAEGILHQIEIALSTDLPRKRGPAEIAERILKAISGKEILVLDDLQNSDAAFLRVMSHVAVSPYKFKMVMITRTKGSFYTPKHVLEGRIAEMEIQGLKKDDALDLLRSRGLDPEVSKDMFERFGGHPLALMLVSENEGLKAYSDISDMIEKEVISSLSEEELSLLRAICVHRSPLNDIMGLIRAGDLSPSALRTLLENGLLETQGETVSVHSLIKNVVGEGMGPDHWKRFNSIASDLYLRSIDRYPSYIEAMYHLSQSDRKSEFVELLRDRGSRALDAGFLELLLVLDDVNPASFDDTGRGYIHALKGEGLGLLGDLEKARHEMELAISAGSKDPSLEAFILERLGNTLRMSGDERGAIGYLERAERALFRMAEKSSMDISRHISALNGLGLSYRAVGEKRSGIDIFRRSIEIASACDPFGSKPALYLNLGRSLMEDGERSKALIELEKGLGSARDLGDEHTASLILGTMGEIEAAQGRQQEAMELFQKALSTTPDPFELEDMASSYLSRSAKEKDGMDMLKRIGSLLSVRRSSEDADLSRLYSMICRVGGERGIAIPSGIHEKAYDMFIDRGMRPEAYKALNNLGVTLSRSGEHARAVDTLMMTLELAQEARSRIMTLYNLSRALKRLNRNAEASSRMLEAKRLAEQARQTDLMELLE
ncbi:MAG: NB-ARC domain-containing protein [Candidatus Thermoplasmatota archaeon]|nr:NB-ARC domain-containing protein [Candidatus Thermoplasmatota archaeon]